MSPKDDELFQLQEIGKLKPVHFADLIRTAQLVFNPASCMSGINIQVDWQYFGISDEILENLRVLGAEYRYALPQVPPEIVWSKLTPQTRIWFIANKDELWKFEEYFPALDED
ncbi:excinuclease ATPase subunit [Calothrix sp. UHCC 0171]|uniref:excinuclease ATPase subunit n=1 Tax=Calothrix sp. UHCC 0171 TaxID=3110245 RepID=UPI002B1EA3ED|nr:excinuclease ATPase subunit [Calothrix sp. UHCC 0171]MEA5572102.1 excinuclease ATPase subunit [Calothrix sp. UHCC 0171]